MPAAATRSQDIQAIKTALAEIPAALLNVRQVAAFIGTTPANIPQMVRRGQFPPHFMRVGLTNRWTKRQILDWIIERKELR